jgi:MFS family permease
MTLFLIWASGISFSVGGGSVIGPIIASEYVPRRYRSTLVALSFSCQYIGYIFAACSELAVMWGLRASIRKVRPRACAGPGLWLL